MNVICAGLFAALVNISLKGIFVLLPAIILAGLRRGFSSQLRKGLLFFSIISLAFLQLSFFTPVSLVKLNYTHGHLQDIQQKLGVMAASDVISSQENANGNPDRAIFKEMKLDLPSEDTLWIYASAVIWAGGVLFCLLYLLKGLSNIRRIKKRSYRPTEDSFNETFKSAVKRAGIGRHIEILLHEAVFSPLSSGLARPFVILPAEASSWSRERLEMVLLHELLHIRKLDYLQNLLIRLVCGFFWFNPLVWFAYNRYRRIQEAACDDKVLEMGIDPCAYAGELLKLTFQFRYMKPAFTLSSSLYGKSKTEVRISEILEKNKARGLFSLKPMLLMAAYVMIFSLMLTAVSFVDATNSGIKTSRQTFPYRSALLVDPSGSKPAADAEGIRQSDIPDLWPVRGGMGKVASCFGMPENIKGHGVIPNPGVNITSGDTMEVIAPADGRAELTGTDFVLIRHKGGIETYLGHLCVVTVSKGREVIKGQTIGFSYTGLIHFEILKGNVAFDPMKILLSKTGTKNSF